MRNEATGLIATLAGVVGLALLLFEGVRAALLRDDVGTLGIVLVAVGAVLAVAAIGLTLGDLASGDGYRASGDGYRASGDGVRSDR
jgi:hypothetical protein